jgi:exopolyphosphatase / guanosine-5'-triphosphate,3'-diphosphate pyrophosphatase
MSEYTLKKPSIIAAIDIGTNSIRLAVVRAEDDQRLTTLASHREVVRLGEGEFAKSEMTPAAMARGALVCAKFADVARGFGAADIIALATSATREAENREEFIEKVKRDADLEIRVISGVEEARLIWLGVSSGIELGSRKALLMDIGGGSTEVIIGNAEGHLILDSLKLGAVRLSDQFFQGAGAFTPEHYAKVQDYVRGVAGQLRKRVKNVGFDVAFGSAGTITTLGSIVAKHTADTSASSQRQPTFRLADLRDVVQMLLRLTLEERRRVPGIDANRAEIILGGAAILQTLMETFGADSMTVSERGLRDGILLDHLLKEDTTRAQFKAQSVRRRSILQLARACKYEAEHAEHTQTLCRKLFDELKRLGLHNYGDDEKELLDYAAITHDIGTFLSHSNHQKHAYYLVRNSDLLGFNDTEIDIVANVALYHRKGIPRAKHANLAALSKGDRKRVSVLAAILRLAEGLDRGHLGTVKDVALKLAKSPRRFVLTLFSDTDAQMEIWGVNNNKDLFEFVFEAPLEVRAANLPQPTPS